ncbi:hypothetical protein EG832_10975, partial [bacterium]|nr:hypothetical protein [bacterium]
MTHKLSNGFTMQTLLSDDQDCTSEAIFVFTKEYPSVMVADKVSVGGIVEEFTDGNPEDHNLSQTEIVNPHYKVINSSNAIPTPVVIDNIADRVPLTVIENDTMTVFDPNEDGLDFYESLESMLVQVNSATIVAPRNNYGEVVILADLFSDKNITSEGGALLNIKNDANPEKLMVKLPTQYDKEVNLGDELAKPIIGVMDYSYGNYKLLAFSPVEFNKVNRTFEPFVSLSDGLTLATYNLENISALDENKKFTEIGRQIVKSLQSPDVLVLNEVMDNSGSADDGVVKADETVKKLINAIQHAGGPEYAFSDTPPINNQDGGFEGGNIRSVLLYREDRGIELEQSVSIENPYFYSKGIFIFGHNPILIGEDSSTFLGTRKPRIWLLKQDGKQFIVAGVHFTSQGANDPDWGSQQPPLKPEEGKRLEEARILTKQLKEFLTLNPLMPIFIAGDMNDLPWSDTISTMTEKGFVNTADYNTPEENYSYIFEGNAQDLDYILVNQNLADSIIQARFIHLNSFLDQSDAISDHDPMVIEFQLD